MKSFSTAVKERTEEEEEYDLGLEFDLDGETLVAFKPDEAQFALLMAAVSKFTTQAESVAGAINFFHAVLDERSAQHVYTRLLDRKDDFGLPEVQDIIEWLVEEWTGHPFQRPSASTGSRKRTGPGSTRTTRPSTSSRSRQPASAT